MERLGTYVHAAGRLWRPGQVPPDEVADLITNPKAWTSQALDRQEMAPATEREPASIPDPSQGRGDDDPNEADATEGATREEGPGGDGTTEPEEGQASAPTAAAGEEPERPAKNAKVDTWRAYILAVADVTQAEVDDMSKEELIDAADQLDAE